ncbi:hypothetical protein BGW38_003144 [Lunasporangiospora selenospora]|uniref:RNI-like protein n=1 Tax=Lunasporangiospora selenospora TaxID=979761 RepID=A0A9P6FR24_9FUNG|nr:hypothetical protein BGW38_003144 [Lunasporangiospora selenospora]
MRDRSASKAGSGSGLGLAAPSRPLQKPSSRSPLATGPSPRPATDAPIPSPFPLLATPYQPHRQARKEYGIPFHGQRIYRRAQFIREFNFNTFAGLFCSYHFEILARSTLIGFRSIDLQHIGLPFSDHLLQILMSSRQLSRLTLGRGMHIPVEVLAYLESCFEDLTELRLIDCPDSMGDNELEQILRCCSRLETLEIHGEVFTDKSLAWIAKSCVNLEVLILEAPKITSSVIEQIAASCPKLKSWTLLDCMALDNTAIEALQHRYCRVNPSSRYAKRLSALMPPALDCFQGLALDHPLPMTVPSNYHPDSYPYLTAGDGADRQSMLTSMSQAGAFATSRYPSSTVSSPSTSSISSHVSDTDHVPSTTGGSTQVAAGSATKTTHPRFSLDRLNEEFMAQTLAPPHPGTGTGFNFGSRTMGTGMLTSIDFRDCGGIRPETVNHFLRTQASSLERLSLGGPSITDDAMDALTKIPFLHLTSLGLYRCTEISDEAMVSVLFNCDTIQELTIFGCNFTLSSFMAISAHLNGLEQLHLEHVGLIMNEAVQEILFRCKQLRVLKLWHCRNLTQDLFMSDLSPCPGLEELEYMDKFPRPYSDGSWEAQMRFLRSIIVRFECLRVLRLTKMADQYIPIQLVSYLCQLDQLEKFFILQSPGLGVVDLKELYKHLPTLTELGVGVSESLSEDDILGFNQAYHRPCVRIYKRMLESSEDFTRYHTTD